MAEQDNTQPIDVNELLGVDDEEVAEAKKRLPDSALLRAAIVGVLVFVGAAIGKPELASNHFIDAVVSGYTVVAPLGLAWYFRRQHKSLKAAAAEPVSTGRHAKQ